MTQCDQKCVRSGDKGSLHLDILKQGVEAWNRWREDQPDVQPDLREANLRGVNLQGANFQDAKFNAAILVNTHLSDVDFTRACLDGAQLHGANLSRANLSFAICIYTMFVGANLSGASLLFTNFTLAFLIGASLHEAYLGDTIFASIDLCAVEGLDTIFHDNPSCVDIKTVQLPGGNTRTHFLRDVGFSDAFIEYLPSLLTAAIQYAFCFICYARQDEVLARRLCKDLQDKGVQCWFAVFGSVIHAHLPLSNH